MVTQNMNAGTRGRFVEIPAGRRRVNGVLRIPRDLPNVIAPTLLIVGQDDADVLELNRRALTLLCCPKELVTIPGATHLFEEPGALEQVARLAEQWFLRHLANDPQARPDPSPRSTASSVPTTRDRR